MHKLAQSRQEAGGGPALEDGKPSNQRTGTNIKPAGGGRHCQERGGGEPWATLLWRYPAEFAAAVAGLAAAGLRGVNVTLPHKAAALAACDKVDDNARRIGAVNTIVFGDDGTMRGFNTDAFGFLENIAQSAAWRAGGSAVIRSSARIGADYRPR